MSSFKHPCLKCGACCSYFHVAFDRNEINPDQPNPVPDYLTIEASAGEIAMLGTDIIGRPRCTALKGRVGKEALCQIYENRPSVCRNFQASYANGTRNPRCDEARLAHDLAPLGPSDWQSPPDKTDLNEHP